MTAVTQTPLMQQYREIKGRHQNAILFFRMGEFYEMFYDDAETASRVLGLTLTARNNGGAAEVPLAGVPVKAAGDYVRLAIRDTGEGIPYRDVPRIFERFYVVDRSRRRESGGGAGLGLAIVKGIVDAHGGAISAESSLGRGTTFTIRIPIVRIKRES